MDSSDADSANGMESFCEGNDDAEECKGIFDEPDDAKSEEAMSQGSNVEMQKERQAENKR